MKRIKVILILSLCIILFCACSSGKPAFSTENISSIYLTSVNPNAEPALVPDEYMGEICQWLDTFTIGKVVKQHQLEPGDNSIGIIIEYSDGTLIKSGIDAIRLGDKLHFINRDPAPDCVHKILK